MRPISVLRGPILNHAIVAVLAAVALLVASGCMDAPLFLGGPSERTAAEWFTGNNYALRCISGSIQAFTIEVDGSLKPASAPVNGEDCEESDYDDGRANTVAGAFSSGSSSTQAVKNPQARQDPREASQGLFGSMPPIPFAPAFPATDLATVSRNCSPGGSAYVVNHRSSTVTKFNVCPVARSTVIRVGSNPLQAAVTPDGLTLLVTRFDGAVVFIDTRTDTIIHTLTSGLQYPNGIAISPDGARAYVTNYDDSNPRVYVIDIASRSVVGSIPTAGFPKSVFLTPDGQQLWVLHFQTPSVSVFDTLSLSLIATVDLGGQADMGMAFNPSGTRAYIGTNPNRIVVLDTSTLDQVTRITLPFWPSDVAVTPDESRVVVNSWTDGSAAVIDARTNQVLKVTTIPAEHSMGLVLYR